MSATTALTRVVVLSVVDLVSQMRTIAKNAQLRREIEMAARRLSTSEVQRRICFMSAKNTASRRDSNRLHCYLCIHDNCKCQHQLQRLHLVVKKSTFNLVLRCLCIIKHNINFFVFENVIEGTTGKVMDRTERRMILKVTVYFTLHMKGSQVWGKVVGFLCWHAIVPTTYLLDTKFPVKVFCWRPVNSFWEK